MTIDLNRYHVEAKPGDAARPWAVIAPKGIYPTIQDRYGQRAQAVRRAAYLNRLTGR